MKKIRFRLALHWQILIAIIIAIPFGIIFPGTADYISWLGTIFMRGLKMVVVPLVFASLVTGITNIGSEGNLGRLGFKTIVFYTSTSLVAILTGLVLVNIFKPGQNASGLLNLEYEKADFVVKPIKETLIEIIPTNVFEALSTGQMLSIILFAIIFGFFITQLKNTKQRESLESFFSAVFEVMMKITLFVIKLAPFGIFGIVVGVVAEVSDFKELIFSLGKFMLVVIIGLSIHNGISLPSFLIFIGRINPLKQLKAVGTALLTAFSTASSNATLPLTMNVVEEKVGVSNKVTSFTLPLGATINMDGTALYELVVVGFAAQLYGIELSIGQQLIVVLTALLSSIGTAGVPMASYVTMTIIFTAVGLPYEVIFILMPIDRPLDMLRTATNVFGDTCGASIIAKSEGEQLNI